MSDSSKFRKIADQLALSIQMGQLINGDRLPPQRKLAAQHGVTLGCITRAYAYLEQLGLVTARLGDGTYVSWGGPAFAQGVRLNMAFNAPARHPGALAAFQRVLAEIAGDAFASGELLAYPPELGLDRHRAAVAEWVRCLCTTGDSKRIMLTNGAQHSIACVIRTLMRPGDVLLTESLSYRGVVPLEQELRLQVVGVGCDAEGLLPDVLERAARTHKAKVLYCIPSLHMPTSTTMTLRRRHEVAAVARRNHLLVIEDCVHALGQANPLPTLSSLVPEQSFLVGSFSKMTAPVLRVGFVEADPKWLGKIALALRADSLASSALMAEILARWIQSGELQKLTQAQRATIRERHDAAFAMLASRRGIAQDDLSAHGDREFPFLWLTLPAGRNADDVAQHLLQQGILVRPSGHFRMGRAKPPQALRISLCAPDTLEQMSQGLETVVRSALRGA
jgi:DNA-binding transcriptional MocR family regulator